MADPYEYEALRDIHLGGDTPGSLPVASFRAGDGVPAEHVKRFGLKVGTSAKDADVKSRKSEKSEHSAKG